MEQSAPQLQIVIFSKDRAMQTHSLLRSLRDHFLIPFTSVHILYKASDTSYASAYESVVRENILPRLAWIPETSFTDDAAQLVSSFDDSAQIMFLVDDDIIYRPFTDAALPGRLTPKHLFISLRCSRTYPNDTPPPFTHTHGYLQWQWNYHKKRWVTWNYPFSVDGHIYSAKVIKKVLRHIHFKAPNSLEGEMHRYRHAWWIKRIKMGLAPLESVIFNNPLNKVQSEGETWNQGISAEELNKKFLDGYRIDNACLYRTIPNNTHTAVRLEFIAPGAVH